MQRKDRPDNNAKNKPYHQKDREIPTDRRLGNVGQKPNYATVIETTSRGIEPEAQQGHSPKYRNSWAGKRRSKIQGKRQTREHEQHE
jgi:hypothetical protein